MHKNHLSTGLRTHTCGELRKEDVGHSIVICGWVHSRRDHGGVIFVDLRDRYGLTQVVFDPSHSKDTHAIAEKIRREYVIRVEGKVRPRKEGMTNPRMVTGEIEIITDKLTIFTEAETPMLEIEDDKVANDDLRLEYRYLDLRRPVMLNNLRLRHDVVKAARDFMHAQGFLEIETPLLIRSTPEGARDYVVPSRVNKGDFYALPQSPQIYKQILMISGVDRYFQVAKCMRDEDLRADRQPEHTQFDLEMSFVHQEDVRNMVTSLYRHIFKTVKNIELPEKFPVFSFEESMSRFGNDKPDLRFDLELTDVTEIVSHAEFGVFKTVIANGGIVKCIAPHKDFTRSDIDTYIDFCSKQGAKGMAWMRVSANGLESNIAKFFSADIQQKLIAATKATPGSTLMFIADKKKRCNEVLSKLRLKLGEDMKLIDNTKFAFCWIVDFPMFEYNEEEQRWDAMHNPFCMPHYDDVEDLENKIPVARAQQYDLVLNGYELGSGAIRISNPELQKKVMGLIGIDEKKAEERFGFLLRAYKFGGPVHGGMGLGVDRLCALMIGTGDIREVIAFPKNKAAQCPMDGCPSPIEDKQLKELSIKLDLPKK